ncbi:MAG: hypothetical protein H0W08_18170 [Acidobacteria bacterium]|nr:hypothetical protein [Acidobacteriota bacterium]
MAWSRSTGGWRRGVHPLIVGGWFVLGFMSKFVAASFLPVIIAVTATWLPEWRCRFRDDWRRWCSVALVCAVAIVPWFLYQSVQSGEAFWRVILGEHVVQRFTTHLDPAHVQRWHYYFSSLYRELRSGGMHLLVAAGLAGLCAQAIRGRSDLATLLLVWCGLPLVALSFGSSKLYHYVYPFLPPLAIAAGLVPGMLWRRDPALERRVSRAIARTGVAGLARRLPRAPAAIRWLIVGLAIAALVVAVVTLVEGTLRFAPGGRLLLRNSSVTRPLFLCGLLLILAGMGRILTGPALAVLMVMASLRPYDEVRRGVGVRDDRLRQVRACLLNVQRSGPLMGVFSHTQMPMSYNYAYYLRPVGWQEPKEFDDAVLSARLFESRQLHPVLLHRTEYAAYRERLRVSDPSGDSVRRLTALPRRYLGDDRYLLLPGRAGACGEGSASELDAARARFD